MNERLPEVQGYRVLEQIGQGGIGRVFLAEVLGEPGRRVALKLLHERIDVRENDVRRLIREARVGSFLHHTNILPILAIEPWRDSHVIVMEYVDGAPLRAWRPECDPPSVLGERVLALASIADALQHAHAHGVVHRDVKPANILVRRDGHPFLIDFGLARTIAVDTTVTATGTILGTPAYLPPEHVAGARSLDARSDLYALGVSLFEIASGELPFQASNLPELFERILHAEPPRLSARIPHSKALDAIVGRALEKRPGDRYGNAAELRDDLRRAARGLRPRGSGASVWVRRELRRLARRRLQLTLATAGILALLSGGLFLGLRSERRAQERAELRQRGYKHLDRGELELSLAAFAPLDELSSGGFEGHLAKADAFAEFQMWERARSEIETAVGLGYRFGDEHPGAADLFLRGVQRFGQHSYADSEADLRAALERDPDQYRAYFVISRLLLREERRSEAVQVLETCRRNLKEVNPRHAAVSAQIHVLAGQSELAVKELQSLAAGTAPPSWLHGLLGYAYLSSYHREGGARADLETAQAEFSRAVESEPGDGWAWSQLGVAWFLGDELDQAERAARRAIELDPRLEAGQRLLAILAAKRGDWPAAEVHVAAFAEETARVGLARTLRSEVAYELGKESYAAGQWAVAIEHMERVVELLPRHLGGWLTLAQASWLIGEIEPARRAFQECHERMQSWQTPGEDWEPWVRESEVVLRQNSLDVEIGLFGTSVTLERALSAQELAAAHEARDALRTALDAGTTLSPASALNLAEALAGSRVEELRDCSWALELIDLGELREHLARRSSAQATMDSIERACR